MPPTAPTFAATTLTDAPTWLVVAGFVVGAGIVWWGGTSLTRWADVVADRTGMGRALVGVLLLAGATSLPEVATTVTASTVGNADLAANNLLGGLAMQLAVLAVVDGLVLRQGALTYFTPKPALLMQGAMLALMCSVATAAIAAKDRFTLGGIGGWSLLLALFYLGALWTMHRYQGSPRWQPDMDAGETEHGEPPMQPGDGDHLRRGRGIPMGRVWLYFSLAAMAVLIGGYLVARSADVLAVRAGISSSLIGATLVAFTTSLPELSTTISAVRIGAYAMAVANIFGTNALSVAMLFLADIAYREGSIINALDDRAIFLASLGTILTCVYLWGLLERRDRTILRFGYDSAAVLALYLAGMGVYAFLGGEGGP